MSISTVLGLGRTALPIGVPGHRAAEVVLEGLEPPIRSL
jgi:hypothetical protein